MKARAAAATADSRWGLDETKKMNIQAARVTAITATPTSHHHCTFFSRSTTLKSPLPSSSSSSYVPVRPSCSGRNNSDPDPKQNSDANGDKFSTDWDKAWSKFRKQGKKKGLFSGFSPNKYVTWNPTQSNYPLSEEVDPIKRTERSNLMLWTSPRFTLFGAIIIVTCLLLYTILAPMK